MTLRRSRHTGRLLPAPSTAALAHDLFASGSPAAAWLAGLIAADGCISSDLKRISIAQSGPHGRAIINEVRRLTRHHLTVGASTPKRGATSYSITLGSPRMVADLRTRFGITPRKTLTYDWPPVPPDLVSAFLRGYVDGDGCVGIYATPQGSPMLHLSFVGTPSFVEKASRHVPASGRVRRIERCRALIECRYNGRHAWQAARWLFADPALPRSAKAQRFAHYCTVLADDPPRWFVWAQQRETAFAALQQGSTVAASAEAAGVAEGTVYAWLKRRRESGSGQA